MIKIPNPSQQPPAVSKPPNQDIEDMGVLCTFKIKKVKIWNMGVSKTSDHILIKIKIPHPSQESPAFPKAPNYIMDVLCTFKFKIENQKPQSDTS